MRLYNNKKKEQRTHVSPDDAGRLRKMNSQQSQETNLAIISQADSMDTKTEINDVRYLSS